MSGAPKRPVSILDLQASLSPKLSSVATVVDGKAELTVDPNRAVVVTYGEIPQDLLTRYIDKHVRHVCQTDAGSLDNEINTAALMIQSPQTFLDYPIASILKPTEANAKTNSELTKLHVPFSQAAQKNPTLDGLRDLLVKTGRPDSLISDAVLVADEMFTNAVFNAPFVNLKTGVNPGVDRNDATVHMPKGQCAELFVGHDDSRLAIVCRDNFGSLNLDQFLRRIHECYVKGITASMRLATQGGAGIGSHMVFNISSSMYVGVCKGKTTVVGASVHWKWSNRRRSESTKNLHCFEI